METELSHKRPETQKVIVIGPKQRPPPIPPKPGRERLYGAAGGKTEKNRMTTTTMTTSVAELAARFLEENVRNCIKPRIFPMESTSGAERVPTPFVFTSDIRIRRRLDFNYGVNEFLERTRSAALLSSTRTCSRSSSSAGIVAAAAEVAAVSSGFGMSGGSPGQEVRRNSGYTMRCDFASALKKWSAPIPPVLSRKLGRMSESPLGKVKVMLRVCENPEEVSGSGILGVDSRRKQVTLIDPGGANNPSITPEERRVGVAAPKMFAFDGGVFTDDDDQTEICAASAAELVASVVGGDDGCFVSLGYCTAGKKQTMFGKAANQKMGIMPTVVSWLFKCIQEQRQKTGSRFSVRVSAVEVCGGSGHEVINDLLLPFVNDGDQPPGSYLCMENGGKSGTTSQPVLNTVSEVRAPNPETAGFFLDTALDAMSREDPIRHFVFTLHVYQYTVDKNGKGVVGGRSRLHCVLLGNGSPSISVLGGLLLAVLNGQRHLPSRDSKLGAILRECLGSLTCRAVVMLHVSNAHSRYAETLAALQLGSRVHRLRRSRRLKMGSVGSGNGSGGSSGGSGEEMRNGNGCAGPNSVGIGIGLGGIGEGETGSSDIDPSSSEQSCDTVIYLGPSIDDATDEEHPPLYLSSLGTTTTPGDNILETKLVTPRTPQPPPKTKSPKPKSSVNKKKVDVNVSTFSKSEEQWVDGPKLSAKFRPMPVHQGASTTNGGGMPKKIIQEFWIDGPIASRVHHQGNNFPSPKKSASSANKMRVGVGLEPSPCSISSVKAQMIEKWISNQTTSPFLDDLHSHFSDFGLQKQTSAALAQFHSNSSSNNHYSSSGLPFHSDEPTYKTLTVFKTCDDLEEDESPSNGYEFEFIEVIEPENPVPTRDAWLQVTEEDIALSFFEENPLPESDQNFTMGADAYYFSSGITPLNGNGTSRVFTPSCRTTLPDRKSMSMSSAASNSTLTEKNDDHPLRVLSQECLTVVSTFTDSLSITGGDIERFWPRLSFPNDIAAGEENGHGQGIEMQQHVGMCNGLCKNLASLSQMSLTSNGTSIYGNGPDAVVSGMRGSTATLELQSSKQKQIPKTTIISSEEILRPPSTSTNTSTAINKATISVPNPPILSDEAIFKIPGNPVGNRKITNSVKNQSASESEQESLMIPAMKLLDLAPIKNTTNTNSTPVLEKSVAIVNHHSPKKLGTNANGSQIHNQQQQQRGCDHNHHFNNNTTATTNGIVFSMCTNGSPSQSLQSISTPTPASPLPLHLPPELIKSPSKSKSRKIAKFFRTRSKSPKITGATSSSESGKSSVSSSNSAETKKSSSSGSSCSSNASASGPIIAPTKLATNGCFPKSPKHLLHPPKSPSKKSTTTSTRNQNNMLCATQSTLGNNDYHFTCDSILPMFLPSPTQNHPNGKESDVNGKN